jgi:mitochondrial fission protein ELM1
MNVLWIKDGNIGHEKQVRVLLDQLLKNKQLNIIERTIKGIFPFFTYINDVEENYYDLIIGAGNKTYPLLLDTKKYQKNITKTVAVLTPSFKKDKFDIICAPYHDEHKLKDINNVIYFKGSLASVSLSEPEEKTILIAIGGKNKHYHFDQKHIISQIKYFISLHPDKDCYIYNSRRTPTKMNDEILSLKNNKNNIYFIDYKNQQSSSFEHILHKASSKLITRDSMNMVFESLSCRGKTYLIDMRIKNKKSKVLNVINNLIKHNEVGSIEFDNPIDGISTMKLKTQNIYNDVFAEVEKVEYKLKKLI